MPRGRPRLDPEVKLKHLKQSRKDYEANTRARVAQDPIAHSKAKQKAAEHSDDYRYRKSEAQRAAHRRASRVKKKVNQRDKEHLYKKHLPARIDRARCIEQAAVAAIPPPQATIGTASSEAGLSGRSLSAIDADSDSENDAQDENNFDISPVASPAFIRPAHPLRCPHCFWEDCIGCACMCSASNVWITHEGGHFFTTCKRCGYADCPGCVCVCPQSDEWVEHGGHAQRRKKRTPKLSRSKPYTFVGDVQERKRSPALPTTSLTAGTPTSSTYWHPHAAAQRTLCKEPREFAPEHKWPQTHTPVPST
ncbi:hypothetical protein FB45DRAFT_1038737 [Roridomyces roridus]|uniref:Uncharacterized protein n=1 Tax=Roridomyces roridus TaxID=1738132 RepID=A0AAD7FB81_9AGAR|nr:hypothetical protein FB45DRAFT_1038737 [Roridomyces roridus]